MALKAVVTGANGFLGRCLCELLGYDALPLTRGGEVTYDRFFDRAEEYCRTRPVLYHLAFARSSGSEDLAATEALIRRFEPLLAVGAFSAVVFAGSQSVYDPYRSYAARETDEVKPKTAYGEAKLKMELWLQDVSVSPVVSARLAALLGRGLPARLPARLCRQAVTTGELSITSGGEQLSFLGPDDAARALVLLGERARQGLVSGPVNVGAERAYTVAQLAHMVAEEARRRGRSCTVTQALAEEPFAGTQLDSGRLRSLGWKPEQSVEQLIKELFDEAEEEEA